MKVTAIAPSNIAFIKYWGKKDEKLRLPTNGSISMNLSNLFTTTTVEFNESFKQDEALINKGKNTEAKNRVINHIDIIRKMARISTHVKIVSKNNFPIGTGLSSSASGFAALTVAATKAAGLNLSEKELTIVARQGSGSACRSIPDGFVEWVEGDTSDTSYAVSLFPDNYWNLIDVVALVSQEKKDISSTEGQRKVASSPFFKERLNHIDRKIKLCQQFLKTKNFSALGQLVENEALEMHAIMMTSSPPLLYWLPSTLFLMKMVKKWRAAGLEVYFTINTGQDVHLIIEEKNRSELITLLKKEPIVKKIIINQPAQGAQIVKNHLF